MITIQKKTAYWFLVLFIALSTGSCVSQKEVAYFQPAGSERDLQSIDNEYELIPKLKKGDILSILVSSLSAEASAMFNPYQSNITEARIQQTTQSTSPNPAIGYLVDEEGNITLPLVGKLKVLGLSTRDAGDLIHEKLTKYLVQPTVNVRILNYRVSILGEVARPAVYTIPNEEITLPEAIALAGDLTIYGKRENVMLIRNTNGKRTFHRIDLTKRDLFNSPYYYLHAGDVVYIEPSKSKIISRDRTVQLAPIILSGISLLTVLMINLNK